MTMILLPTPRHSRNPLIRIASLLLGIALLGVLLFFGLIVAGALLVGACAVLIARAWTKRHAPPKPPGADAPGGPARAAEPQVLEGEFIVVHDEHQPPR